MTTESDALITVEQAARESGVAPAVVRRWIERHELPAQPVDGALLRRGEWLIIYRSEQQRIQKELALLDRIEAQTRAMRERLGGFAGGLEELHRGRESRD